MCHSATNTDKHAHTYDYDSNLQSANLSMLSMLIALKKAKTLLFDNRSRLEIFFFF